METGTLMGLAACILLGLGTADGVVTPNVRNRAIRAFYPAVRVQSKAGFAADKVFTLADLHQAAQELHQDLRYPALKPAYDPQVNVHHYPGAHGVLPYIARFHPCMLHCQQQFHAQYRPQGRPKGYGGITQAIFHGLQQHRSANSHVCGQSKAANTTAILN